MPSWEGQAAAATEEKTRAIEVKLGLEKYQMDKAPGSPGALSGMSLQDALFSLPAETFKHVSALIYTLAAASTKGGSQKSGGASVPTTSAPSATTAD